MGESSPRGMCMGLYKEKTGVLFALPAIVFLATLIVYPIIYNIWVSFFNVNYFTGKSAFIGLGNYTDAITDTAFWRALGVNVVWTIGSLAGQFLLGLIVALLINNEIKGISVFRTLFLIPYILPIIAATLTWKWLFNDLWGIISFGLQRIHLIPPDTSPLSSVTWALPIVIIINIWRGFPFVAVVYWAALRGIPKEEYEAAEVDGASKTQSFFYITLPHLKNTTLVLLILRAIWTFNYFDLIYLVTEGGPAQATQHLPIMIYMRSMGTFKFGSAAAIAIMSGMVFVVFAWFYLRMQKKEA